MAKNKAKMNKFLTGAITATMVATAVAPIASAAAFTDLDRVDESVKAEIDNAVELGFFNDGTKFNPSTKITRGQAALTLARYIAGEQTVKAYAEANKLEDKVTAFKDVPASYKNGADFQQELYYASLIVKNAEAFTQANLNPAGDVTRSQMAKIITETFDLKKAAGYESTITDIDHLDAATKSFIETIASHGVTNVDTFNPAGHVTRSQMASFLVRSYDVVNPSVGAPEITGVSAINAKTAKVTFKNAVPANVDFSNFEIDGGKVVTEAKLSADRKSAEITVNSDFVRNQEYTVTVTGIEDADGKVYADSTGKFTWVVQEGVTVGLEKTTVDQGEKFGLTVKDADGKDVKDATVKVTSFNTNLLEATTATGAPNKIQFTAQDLAGEVEVEVETTLIDGTVLKNTFKVTVKEPVINIADKGYGFLENALTTPLATSTEYQYSNTAAFQKFAKPTTKLVEGEDAQYFYAYAETNGNPDDAHIDWTKAEKVASSNAVTATAILDKTAGTILVKPNKVGTTTLTVTFDDKTKRTFNIEVTAKPVFKDLFVSQTDVKLSDEAKNTGAVEGVNLQTVKMHGLDQFKEFINTTTGKVVISTNTKEGLNLGATAKSTAVPADNTVTLDATELAALVKGDEVFTIGAEAGKPVKDAKVTINYFANETDAKPTLTKTINVNVTDVDSTVKASGLDLILTHTEIDANGDNNPATNIELDFADAKQQAYLLDSKGNRIGTTAVSVAEYETEADKNVELTAPLVLSFADTEAQTYLRDSNTVTVQVTAEDIGTHAGEEIKKNVAVKYENTAVIPDKATVKTNAVSIKLADSVDTISLEQILFGIGDEEQLKLDDAVSIAVLKNAKNAGYKYNQPLVTVTGTDGKALPLGVSLYGSTAAEYSTASQWNNAFTNAQLLVTPFASDAFDFEYEVTNIVTSDATATVDDADSGDVVVPVEESATFTLVVKAIYIEGDDVSTDAAKAKNNLLASPVQLNVSVEGADQ